jgi:hypothetical protein
MRTRDKKALSIAALAAAVFIVLEFGVLPLWDRVQAEREGLPVKEQTLLKYREAVEAREEREQETAALEARLQQAEAGLIAGETPAIASAGLRQQVQQMAAEHGMEVVGIQFLPSRLLGEDYVQAPLGVQLAGKIDGLAGFLQACETGPTTLNVTGLNVQATSNDQKTLNVNLTLAGILPSTGGQ